MSLADAEQYVESAYGPVFGLIPPGLSLSVGRATSKGMTIVEQGAGCAGRLKNIRENLCGSIDLAVLEVCYRAALPENIEGYVMIVADRFAMSRGIKIYNAVNAINKAACRAEIDDSEWAEACGLKISTVHTYTRWARADLKRMRRAACLKAFEY